MELPKPPSRDSSPLHSYFGRGSEEGIGALAVAWDDEGGTL